MDSFSPLYVLGLILILSSHIAKAQDSPEDYLKVHNAARSAIMIPNKMPNLVWNNNLAAFAQSYANKRKKDCKPIPSGSGGRYGEYLGENIATSTGDMSGINAVKKWVDEKPHYNHYVNICVGGECLHFTQVVWKNSSSVGCAKVKCDNGGTFVTCNYDPPGNIVGQSPY